MTTMALMSFDDPTTDMARQFLLDRRCERLHPKRHRTQKRARAMSKKKRAAIKRRDQERKAAHSRHLAAVRAYWSGEADGHPGYRP